jgi:hypothetical protein
VFVVWLNNSEYEDIKESQKYSEADCDKRVGRVWNLRLDLLSDLRFTKKDNK